MDESSQLTPSQAPMVLISVPILISDNAVMVKQSRTTGLPCHSPSRTSSSPLAVCQCRPPPHSLSCSPHPEIQRWRQRHKWLHRNECTQKCTHTQKSLRANSHMGEVLEIRFWTIYLASTCVKKKKKRKKEISLSHPITYMHRDRVEFRVVEPPFSRYEAGPLVSRLLREDN